MVDERRGNDRHGETVIPVERVDDDNTVATHGSHERTREHVPDYMGDAFRSRVSWGAIFAGTVIGVATMAMLSLLGMAWGLSLADFGPGQDGASGVPTGAAIWFVLSQLIALGVGGFVAGRLAAVPKTVSAALHGAAVWGLTTLLTLYIASSAIGSLVNGATSMISTVASGVAQVAPAAAPDQQTQSDIAAQTEAIVGSVVSEAERNRAANAAGQAAEQVATGEASVGEAVRDLTGQLFGSGGVIGPDDREQAIATLADRTGMSEAEAAQAVDNAQRQVQQIANSAPATVGKAATAATDALATVALIAFLASLISLIAAVVGAAMGRPGEHEVDAPIERRRA